MKRRTSLAIATTLMLATTVLGIPNKANSQDVSNLNRQDGRDQIETSTTTNGCWYVPYMGWRCN